MILASRLIGAVLFVLLGWMSATRAQSPLPALDVDCGGIYDLCGFRDRQTKNLVIPQKFERAFPFSEGLAAVRVKGQYGFIDERGELVIQPKFDLAGGFFQGLAEVLVGDKSGMIDRSGNIVVQPQFARSMAFTKDVLLVREGKWQSIHFRDHEKLDTLSEGLELFSGSNWGLYHIRTGWLTKPQFSFNIFDRGERGLIWATTGDQFLGLHGLLRADGKWQVEPQFTHVQRLMDNRAIIGKAEGTLPSQQQNQLRGAVDEDGKLVVPLRNWHLSYWVNGFGLVIEGGKAGLIDKSGNIIGGRLFDGAERGETGDIGKVLLDGKWLGLDRMGQIVANPDDGKVIASCPSGLKLLLQTGKVEVVGPDGRPSVPYLLDYSYNKLDCDNPSIVRLGGTMTYVSGMRGGKWGYIGLDGQLLFDPPAFDNILGFDEGHAAVQRDGKWGFIDTAGRFTVEPRYETLQPAGKGLYKVKLSGREFWTSATGQEQPAPPADPMSEIRANHLACGNFASIVWKSGLFGIGEVWGISDKDGREIIRPQYRAIQCFQQGVAWAAIDSKRQWCPIDPDGSVRTNPACVPERYPHVQTHSYPETFVTDPYENSVLWTRAFLEFGAGKRSEPPRMIGDGVRGGSPTIRR
jgi:hypothetical protein